MQGTPTTGVAGFDGGDAYYLDGSDDWLLDGNAESTYLGSEESLTVSMWVKADSTGTNAGLIDTSDDDGDGQDDEFGLRYDASGYEGGATNTCKSSIAVDQGYREAYAYEIDSLASNTGFRRGSFNTSWKDTSRNLDLSDLRLGYDTARNGGTVRVAVYARHDDGTVGTSTPVELNGDSGVREIEGLAGDADEFTLGD